MDTHIRNLGVISIVWGVLSTAAALFLMIWFNGPTGLFNAAEDVAGAGFITASLVLAHLLLGPPLIASAFFVMRYHQWARAVMIALCGINLLNIPVGSLLSIYGLWVLMTPETEPLFTTPPHRSHRPGKA
ncbi:MAG: hypothetical protein H7039_11980 [Bryobacteraceae bacterium]|nr:hypothetical protein [Bryobacteraceae bacterium]